MLGRAVQNHFACRYRDVTSTLECPNLSRSRCSGSPASIASRCSRMPQRVRMERDPSMAAFCVVAHDVADGSEGQGDGQASLPFARIERPAASPSSCADSSSPALLRRRGEVVRPRAPCRPCPGRAAAGPSCSRERRPVLSAHTSLALSPPRPRHARMAASLCPCHVLRSGAFSNRLSWPFVRTRGANPRCPFGSLMSRSVAASQLSWSIAKPMYALTTVSLHRTVVRLRPRSLR